LEEQDQEDYQQQDTKYGLNNKTSFMRTFELLERLEKQLVVDDGIESIRSRWLDTLMCECEVI
jgi:hypothetical protein